MEFKDAYEGYPERPYISKERDMEDWQAYPEKYPYGVVEKRNMVRLDEGILPGDIVMLWRIGFGNFTTETHIPNYFEYRYGVESLASLERLEEKAYAETLDAKGTLDLISMPVLKRILEHFGLKKTGKKQELVDRMLENVGAADLGSQFSERKIAITERGRDMLKKYDAIIQRHGPKM